MLVMSKKSILETYAVGDHDAFETLYREYSGSVYRWSLFLGLPESAAEEVTQDVFITAFRKYQNFKGERGIAAWLFQITRKLSANYRRKRWVKEILWPNREDENRQNVRQGAAMNPQLSMELRQILQKLPIKLTEILVLHDLDGLTQKEISEQLGVPTGTVASRLNKARQTFRDKWTPR